MQKLWGSEPPPPPPHPKRLNLQKILGIKTGLRDLYEMIASLFQAYSAARKLHVTIHKYYKRISELH